MDLTRRTFLAGLGSVTVGLLFTRRLECVLDDLSRESVAELSPVPATAEQLPVAADIIVRPQAAFRPERLIIRGTVVGTRRVPVCCSVDCSVCDGEGETADGLCDACTGVGYVDEATDEMREENVIEVPWIVEDIAIGTQSQLCKSGGIPGDLFSSAAFDSFVSFASAAPGSEIRVRVRYVGDKPEGEPFVATFVGCVVGDGRGSRAALPVNSIVPIAAERSALMTA